MTLSTTELASRFEQGQAITRAAGRLALDFFRRRLDLAIEHKGRQDFVSIADKEVETLIRNELAKAFPEDGILGEEHGGAISERMWVIDPIDGTANFLRGLPYWSTVLAYVVDGEPVLGFTMDPVHDELFAASREVGAFRDGQPIHASGAAQAAESCIGLGYTFKADPDAYRRLIAGLLEGGYDHRRLGSSALMLAHVADGRLDGMMAPLVHSWDVLAGLCLVKAAGGHATTYCSGGRTLLDPRPVLGCAPGLRETLTALAPFDT